MDNKGSVLIISLWVLTALVLFAIGLSHRAAVNLRLSRYQRDILKASCFARAGINMAISELEKDEKEAVYDGLNETWSTGIDPDTKKPLFTGRALKEGSLGTFTVRYIYEDDSYLCMQDEGRKLSINLAGELGKQQLIELLLFKGISEDEAIGLASTVVDWIDPDDIDSLTKGREMDIFKNEQIKKSEELIMPLEYFYQVRYGVGFHEKAQEVYHKIEDSLTALPESGLNLNTVSGPVLTVFIKALLKVNNSDFLIPRADGLVNKINLFKENNVFDSSDANRVIAELTDYNLTDEEKDIINQLNGLITVKSDNFRIACTGSVNGMNKKIIAIYDRAAKKIAYWHEN